MINSLWLGKLYKVGARKAPEEPRAPLKGDALELLGPGLIVEAWNGGTMKYDNLSAFIKAGFVLGATALSFYSLQATVVAICATILVILYGQIGSLIEVSFGPLKAKLERDVTEAERLTHRLRSLAAVQARASIAASANTGRFASKSDWIFASAKRVERALRELGVSEEELREARTDLVDLTIEDAGRAALGLAYVPNVDDRRCESEWRELCSRSNVSDPDAIEAWLHKWSLFQPDHEVRLRDMRWMIANRDVADSAMYMRAHTPVGDKGLTVKATA